MKKSIVSLVLLTVTALMFSGCILIPVPVGDGSRNRDGSYRDGGYRDGHRDGYRDGGYRDDGTRR